MSFGTPEPSVAPVLTWPATTAQARVPNRPFLAPPLQTGTQNPMSTLHPDVSGFLPEPGLCHGMNAIPSQEGRRQDAKERREPVFSEDLTDFGSYDGNPGWPGWGTGTSRRHRARLTASSTPVPTQSLALSPCPQATL